MTDDEDIPADLSTLIRLGTILSVTLDPPRCVVRYGDPDTDEDCETPPIRWVAGRAGATRSWSPPSVGEEVVLLSPDGQIGNAIALLGLYNESAPPPANGPAEVVEFNDGARISYDPATHSLTLQLPAGATIAVEATGGLKISGDVTVEGTLLAQGDVVGAGVSLKHHTHSDVQPGNKFTGPPS